MLDTNVWVSALLFGGQPARLVQLARDGQVQLCMSQALLSELADVLRYPKFQSRLQRIGTTPESLLINISRLASFGTKVVSIDVPELRDLDDKIVLEAAIAAQAVAIVSGDDDLLVLKSVADIPILTVKAFLACYFPDW
ncbi:PIN domain-containing protein [Leptolyngbya sp. BL0902]|nr:PIN domain-containing protein [Leptolyngbya sp. BL0902]